MPRMPNTDWICEIGPERPRKPKAGQKPQKRMSRLELIDKLQAALLDITTWTKNTQLLFHSLKVLRRPGKSNILRLRFYAEPWAVKKLERQEGFVRLPPQADYDK